MSITYRAEIFVKRLNLGDYQAVVGIFIKARRVVIADGLQPRVQIWAGEDLIITETVLGSIACPCKFAGVLMARAPTIYPSRIEQVLIVICGVKRLTVTIDKRDAAIHIPDYQRVHFEQ